MAINYRRGSAAIQDAATRKGGDFRPFIPQISWRNDGDTKYVLVLTDLEDVAQLSLHSFIPVGKGKKANGEEFTRYEEFLSRKDTAVGEDYDDLEDRLGQVPKVRCMGVLVELDPVIEPSSKKLKGFAVKTETFQRQTDDGEVEVTAPVIGLCTQSAITLWGTIDSYNKEVGPLIDVPLQITRRGKDQNTRYDIIPYLEKPVDVAPVIDFLDGINYIGDDLTTVMQRVEAEETETAQAQAVADFLLVKRIEELADAERYEELVGPLNAEDIPNKYGRKAKTSNAKRPARPARRSPRETPEAQEETPAEEATVTTKSARFEALKSRVESRA